MARQLELWDDLPLDKVTDSSQLTTDSKQPAGKRWDNERVGALADAIAKQAGIPVELRVTDNRSILMKVEPPSVGHVTRLHLHWMFLDATPEIVNGLARWIKVPKSKKETALFRAFMSKNTGKVRGTTVRRQRLRHQGQYVDLNRLYEELNAEEFSGSVNAMITWGKAAVPKRRRGGHIRFGSYDSKGNLIRIHPVLDSAEIPLFFVRYIVFHEMLHAFVGIGETENLRRSLHGPEFRSREKAYRDFKQAEAWLKHPGNLDKLLKDRGRIAAGLSYKSP